MLKTYQYLFLLQVSPRQTCQISFLLELFTLNAKWFHIFYDKLKANNILSVLTRHDLIKYNRYVSKNKTAG